MKLTIILLTAWAVTGCASQSYEVKIRDQDAALRDAKKYLQSEELYRAKKMTGAVLEVNPSNAQAQNLMAQILDQEIAREKEVVEPKSREEFTSDEKTSQIRTWLDRARTLLSLKQYDRAVLAAEKVFLYDAENGEASRLIDEIKRGAYRDGKQDTIVLGQILDGEVQIRVEEYRRQAAEWIQKGQWGAARLAVEKILLLQPGNRDAQKLQKEIQARSQTGSEAT